MSLTVVPTSGGARPFFTTAAYSPALVSCAAFADADGARLESIRDRGTCLDAARALFPGSTFPTSIEMNQVNVGVNEFDSVNNIDLVCSGCFVFTYPKTDSQPADWPLRPARVRYCDYDPSVQFDGLTSVVLEDYQYWPLCIGAV